MAIIKLRFMVRVKNKIFCFIDDLLNGLEKMEEKGSHLEIFILEVNKKSQSMN